MKVIYNKINGEAINICYEGDDYQLLPGEVVAKEKEIPDKEMLHDISFLREDRIGRVRRELESRLEETNIVFIDNLEKFAITGVASDIFKEKAQQRQNLRYIAISIADEISALLLREDILAYPIESNILWPIYKVI